MSKPKNPKRINPDDPALGTGMLSDTAKKIQKRRKKMEDMMKDLFGPRKKKK